MASKSKRARLKPEKDLTRTFLNWSLGMLVVKLINRIMVLHKNNTFLQS